MNCGFYKVREKNDIETVCLLADTIWREHYAEILSDKQIDYMLAKFQSEQKIRNYVAEGGCYYIIDVDGLPVGYFAFRIAGRKVFLDKLYVLKENRGMHVGKEVVEFVKNFAVSKNIRVVYLTVNKHNSRSIKAYRALGFSIEGAVCNDIGNGFYMDDYLMYLYL